MEIYPTSVNKLEISIRAKQCLERAKIKTLGQLSRQKTTDFLRYRNFGIRSIEECQKVLKKLGIEVSWANEWRTLKEQRPKA